MASEPSSPSKQKVAAIEGAVRAEKSSERVGGPKPSDSHVGNPQEQAAAIPGDGIQGLAGTSAPSPEAPVPQPAWPAPDLADSGGQPAAAPQVKSVKTLALRADSERGEAGGHDRSLPARAEGEMPLETVPESAWGSAVVPRENDSAKPRSQAKAGQTVDEECLPTGLKTVLGELEAQFGAVTIVSTTHLHTDNHAAGSAREKMHSACQAVDIKTDADPSEVVAFLRGRPEIGGVQNYRNKVIHFDAKGAERTAMRQPASATEDDEQAEPVKRKARPKPRARVRAQAQAEPAIMAQPEAEKPAERLPWPLSVLQRPEPAPVQPR